MRKDQIDNNVFKSLQDRYFNIHPLIFHRSIEKSQSLSDLFDILESFPGLPAIWDDEHKTWKKITDICLQDKFDFSLIS